MSGEIFFVCIVVGFIALTVGKIFYDDKKQKKVEEMEQRVDMQLRVNGYSIEHRTYLCEDKYIYFDFDKEIILIVDENVNANRYTLKKYLFSDINSYRTNILYE